MAEAIAVVSGLDDMAVMGQPVEQRRGHLRIAEHTRPLGEAEIGRDEDAGALIEFADQVEQQCAAGLAERQITELVEDDDIGMDQPVGDAPLLAVLPVLRIRQPLTGFSLTS